jgi:hypothetical protein
MIVSDYEKTLMDVLEKNPNINTRKFIKLAALGKTTFYKYTKRLEDAGYISYQKKKNQRVWSLIRADKRHDLGLVDLKEDKRMEKWYQEIESKVMTSLQEIKKGNISDKIDVYGNAVVLILATLGSMKLVSIYRNKQMPSSYIQFIKKLEQLLEKISDSKFFSDYGFGRTAIDIIADDARVKLDEFLGIDLDKDKKISIY